MFRILRLVIVLLVPLGLFTGRPASLFAEEWNFDEFYSKFHTATPPKADPEKAPISKKVLKKEKKKRGKAATPPPPSPPLPYAPSPMPYDIPVYSYYPVGSSPITTGVCDEPPCMDVCPCDCDPGLFVPMIFSGRYRGGDGRGYHTGYSTVEGFFALYQNCSTSYPFIDLQLHGVGKDFRLASSVGVGWRILTADLEQMFGVNAYYDYWRFKHGNLKQVGIGGEFLGSCWDFRINGYIPFGRKQVFKNIREFDYEGGFFAIRDKFKRAAWGLDFEVGTDLFSCNCYDIYVAAGPYFYNSQVCCCSFSNGGDSFIGGMGRVEADIGECWTVSFYVTYDRIFHTCAQGEVCFTIPIPSAVKCCACLFERVYRNEIIIARDRCCWTTNF